MYNKQKKIRTILLTVLIPILFCMVSMSIRGEENEKTRSLDQALSKKEELKTAASEVHKDSVLRVGIPSSDLPAFYEDKNGVLQGNDIELARGIADALGLELEFNREADNNDELTEKLENGEIDMIIATYSRTLDRVKRVNLSEPYLSIGMGIMVNKQAMVQRRMTSDPVPYLKVGKERVAVIGGTSHVSLCRKLFPNCEIVEAKDYDEAARLVKNNEVFAYFCGELEFYSQFLQDEELNIYTNVYVFSDVKDEFCIATAKERDDLNDFVNLYLEMSQPITIDNIHSRYRAILLEQNESSEVAE